MILVTFLQYDCGPKHGSIFIIHVVVDKEYCYTDISQHYYSHSIWTTQNRISHLCLFSMAAAICCTPLLAKIGFRLHILESFWIRKVSGM